MNVAVLLTQKPTFRSMSILFLLTFIIRAAVMFFVVQPHQFYKQPDSMDYHISGYSISEGIGMYHLQNKQPLFWRTPGYGAYLAPFYYFFKSHHPAFENNQTAQCTAIWVQIILSSAIPLIILFLALTITQSLAVSWIAALIAVFHVGFVLAATFLLTEGAALIFFYLFLFFLFRVITKPGPWLLDLLAAIATLSIYTWMRPNGEVVAIGTALALLFCIFGTWRENITKALLFFALFFASIFPWYLRNYQLTHEWFFAPTIGPYLNVFSAPKVLSHITGKPLLDCWKECGQNGGMAAYKKSLALRGTKLHVSPLACKEVALEVIRKHWGWFILDWLQEVNKTTLDLYSCQLTSMANNSFYYDPLHELLTEKVAATLWREPQLPWYGRIIAWLELLYQLLLWIGLLAGTWYYFLHPLLRGNYKDKPYNRYIPIWFAAGLIIGAVIVPSGGFGYARLRLPAEPLLMILALLGWYYLWARHREPKA